MKIIERKDEIAGEAAAEKAKSSPTFSFLRISTGSSPSRIFLRISGTHFGHRESVSRGQPRGGFCFSQLFRRGLSDHFGVNEGF